MSILSDFVTRTKEKLHDAAGDLTDTAIQKNISQAVKIYSRLLPREVVADMYGTGEYLYDLPPDFDPDFSSIRSIEYPLGSQNPSIIPPEDYILYKSPVKVQLRFIALSPKQTFRLTYTTPHSVTDAVSTIPEKDFDAVCDCAAALCCYDLSRKYGQFAEATLGADVTDRQARSDIYATRAKELMNAFLKHVLGEETEVSPAIFYKDLDVTYETGENLLIHKSRLR